MNIDNPTSTQGYTYRVLKTPGFAGVAGDGRIHVVGMTGTTSTDGSDKVNLWLINARPSVDSETGQVLDNTVVGGNHTIDVFSTRPLADEMYHVQTFANAQIATPNNLAVTKSGGFFFTNDHGPHKVGWVSHVLWMTQSEQQANPEHPNRNTIFLPCWRPEMSRTAQAKGCASWCQPVINSPMDYT